MEEGEPNRGQFGKRIYFTISLTCDEQFSFHKVMMQ